MVNQTPDRAGRLDPAMLDRAEAATRSAAGQPEHAREAELMAVGIRQIRAADGNPDQLPLKSAGEVAAGYLRTVDASSLGSHQARAAQNLDLPVNLLVQTYSRHYRSLVSLAALLLDDTAACEDVVQEAFIRIHSARNQVRDPDKTLAYLRQTVVNLSRSALRHRILGLRLLPKPMPDMASAEEGAYDALERDQLIVALRGLQRRQREVLVLRYFSDMTDAQVAEALGISIGSVKAYASRGLATLRTSMEKNT